MLVLTRKLMEKLFIGDNICVTVVRLEGGQVRLGIEAPRDVAVVRAELVPERASAYRNGHRNHAAAPAPAADAPASTPVRPEPALRIPQAAAHGTDSRRPERSR